MDAVGWIALALFQAFYVPQSLRMLRSRQVEGLSLTAWLILWLAMALYLAYSIARHDVVFIAGNSLGLAQTSFQISLILRFRKGALPGRNASPPPPAPR